MLVLTRKLGASIIINNEIRVTVVEIERNSVRLGIEAPPEIPILREELLQRMQEFAESQSTPAR